MDAETLAVGKLISIRKIISDDLAIISQFEYSVSITEPHSDIARLAELHRDTGMWTEDSGAVAIVNNTTQRMMGTLQHYRSAPCIHGQEIGYLIHSPDDRRNGYVTEALRLFSDLLFSTKPDSYRQQLIIEAWNTASWKVAERSGFIREGVLRSCGFGDGDPADCFVYSRTQKDYSQELTSTNGLG